MEIAGYLRELPADHPSQNEVNSMTRQTLSYVDKHIQNPSLALKYTVEQYLLMNTDYVSKKFQKGTGTRSSSYLTSI